MKHSSLPVALSLLLAAGLQLQTGAADTGPDTGQIHSARGVVREIAANRLKAVIRHEAITNYMPAMTMEFNVRDANELGSISAGDTIAFRLVATGDTHWIDSIRKVVAGTNNSTDQAPRVRASIPELKPGDLLPDYELIAQDGRKIRISDFRGKALAFAFFFTRCPLPDYCPRTCNNFAKAREIVLTATNAPANWQLLMISFDPDFDQPNVLSAIAGFYRAGNPKRWIFAAASTNTLAELAPRLDLMVMRESGGSISHNLRAVVLDPQGRIYRQFDGNEWKPEQLAAALMEAAQLGKQP